MATRTTTTKKTNTTTKATAPTPIVPTKEEKTKRVFKDTDPVTCRSITLGKLFMEGLRTHDLYTWLETGDVIDVEYRDLMAAVRTRSTFLFTPYIIVDDPDFVEQNPVLEKFYDSMYTTRDFREILELPVNQMKKALAQMPKKTYENFKVLAMTMVKRGELDSVTKIKALDEILDTDIDLLSQM